jgi:hypothetical protein
VSIGDDPANEHEEQDRQLTQETVEPEIEVRSRQAVDEIALREALHPRADGRRERRHPEDAKVAVGERDTQPLMPATRLLDVWSRAAGGQCHVGRS